MEVTVNECRCEKELRKNSVDVVLQVDVGPQTLYYFKCVKYSAIPYSGKLWRALNLANQ